MSNRTPGHLPITDEDLRLIISSLDKRIKRLVKVTKKEPNLPDDHPAIQALTRLNELTYRLRNARREVLNQL